MIKVIRIYPSRPHENSRQKPCNMRPLCSSPWKFLTLLVVSLNSIIAFNSSSRPLTQVLQASKNNSINGSKKKNPMDDAILFGKPQYNWVTGKAETRMTSTYVHNWNVNVRRKEAVQEGSSSTDANARKNEGKEKKRPWWRLR